MIVNTHNVNNLANNKKNEDFKKIEDFKRSVGIQKIERPAYASDVAKKIYPLDVMKKTKDLSMFRLYELNRPVNPNSYTYKLLYKSIVKDGFWSTSPLACIVGDDGMLVIEDGHIRFTIASALGIEVYYVVHAGTEADLAERIKRIDVTKTKWTSKNWIDSYVGKGHPDYIYLDYFSTKHGWPPIEAAVQLMGKPAVDGGGGMTDIIREGLFKATNKESAEKVAVLCGRLRAIHPMGRNASFVNAVARCLKVEAFDPDIFVARVNKHPSMFHVCSSVNDFLVMFREIYNKGAKNRISLDFYAKEVKR